MEPLCELSDLLITECAHCLRQTLAAELEAAFREQRSYQPIANREQLVACVHWGSAFCTSCGGYIGSWEPVRMADDGPVCDRCFA